MDGTFLTVAMALALALAFCFMNGFHDSSGLVATMISTRAMEPEWALVVATAFEFIGAQILGTAVAETMMSDLVDVSKLAETLHAVPLISAGLLAAVVWNAATWFLGIPSSSSHTLLGGLMGAFAAGCGLHSIYWSKILWILVVLVVSPLVGFFASYFITKLSYFLFQWSGPRVNSLFRKMQIVSSCCLALSHGTNDAQKTIGIMALVLALAFSQQHSASQIPGWVVNAAAMTISFGVLCGGWRLIKTLGFKLYRVRPIHGFASQGMSSGVLIGFSLWGFPLSSTQVISSSLLGAGAADRPKAIRWEIVRDMVMTWLVTLPVTGLLAASIVWLMKVVE